VTSAQESYSAQLAQALLELHHQILIGLMFHFVSVPLHFTTAAGLNHSAEQSLEVCMTRLMAGLSLILIIQ
jgi:hypothetical protein